MGNIKYKVGDTFETKHYGFVAIIKRLPREGKLTGRVLIRFLNTGNERVATIDNIIRGGVKDYGVGKYTTCGGYMDIERSGYEQASVVWKGILDRCLNTSTKKSVYKGVKICDEWMTFSNFAYWFNEHYVEGFDLDKDIMSRSLGMEPIYSPQVCRFVPVVINAVLTKRQRFRGKYPIGVTRKGDKYYARCGQGDGTRKFLGSFDTTNEAFYAYKTFKEGLLKKLADKYKEHLSDDLYEALYNYEVKIDD